MLTMEKSTKYQCLGLYYHCDDILFYGHWCKDYKLFFLDMAPSDTPKEILEKVIIDMYIADTTYPPH
jgi:hypothetical protein